MNVLPRACARLLLLSLLCATGLCQWSKSEWSRAGSVCHLPLDTVYLSWAPETPVLVWITPAGCFSCCFGARLLLPRCCFAASFH